MSSSLCSFQISNFFTDLVKASHGRIIFVTSIKARLAFPECGPYTCTKWALEAYMDSLRRELKDFNVTVHGIQPGGFKTNLVGTVPEKFKSAWKECSNSTKMEYGEDFFKVKLCNVQ